MADMPFDLQLELAMLSPALGALTDPQINLDKMRTTRPINPLQWPRDLTAETADGICPQESYFCTVGGVLSAG